MQQLTSFLSGSWQSGRGRERTINHAITGEALFSVTSEGLDMAQARRYAIEHGGAALGKMTLLGHVRKTGPHLACRDARHYQTRLRQRPGNAGDGQSDY